MLENRDSFKSDNDVFAPRKRIGAEERSLPALEKAITVDFNKANESEFEHQKPGQTDASNITLKVDKKFSSLFDRISGILGEELAKKVWADKWYFQQEGIDYVISNLQTSLSSATDSDKSFLVGIISDIWADADLKTYKENTKSLKIIKKYK